MSDDPKTSASEERDDGKSRLHGESVKAEGGALEARLKALLRGAGLLPLDQKAARAKGWDLPGSPDLIFPKEKLALFADGCFWHGCPQHQREPKSHQEYWGPKLARNRERDHEVDEALREQGWMPLRLWEHEIQESPEQALEKTINALRALGSRRPAPKALRSRPSRG